MSAGQVRTKRSVIAIVACHMALLAACTLPAAWVPTRVRYWSQAYSRVLFHQDWRLFAPDPPTCGCAIQVKGSRDSHWVDLDAIHSHFLWERMCSNACRYAEVGLAANDSIVKAPIALTVSLERMAQGIPCKGALQARALRTGASPEVVGIKLTAH
ncbi:MAG: hypothetical protein IPG74_00825 [Flavobacteriales bacterium]|nr:hypothetical protein [Flavobacteriales bacterium]